MPKVEDYQYLDIVGTDLKFPCIMCSANHSHIGKYNNGIFKGKFIRYCEDCLELLEDDIMMEAKITSGTKEWADSNVNVYSGCDNNCSYCYAKKMAIRFKRKSERTWRIPAVNFFNLAKGYGKRKGRIMFPTSHDITRKTKKGCFFVLRKLLEAGNEVLVTTKPDPTIICELLVEFKEFKRQIQFRFTITSYNDEILQKYEPNAPIFRERLMALLLAYDKGWKTSVSIEPFLDKDPIPLIIMVSSACTESIWLGKLNYQKTNFNTWKNIKNILEEIKKLPDFIRDKIRLKDSIRNLCAKHNYYYWR